jgi:hypothetical protein
LLLISRGDSPERNSPSPRKSWTVSTDSLAPRPAEEEEGKRKYEKRRPTLYFGIFVYLHVSNGGAVSLAPFLVNTSISERVWQEVYFSHQNGGEKKKKGMGAGKDGNGSVPSLEGHLERADVHGTQRLMEKSEKARKKKKREREK